MILGICFLHLSPLLCGISAQLRPNFWHLDSLCVRDKVNFITKGGAFALSGKGVEVHIFSTGIFEHNFIKSRVTYVYGGTDVIGRGTQLACIVGGQEVGIAKECHFFSYSFSTDSQFVEAVDAFLVYKTTHIKKPTVILIDIDKTPVFENKHIALLNNSIEFAIKKITDLNYIVLVPAGDGYRKDGVLLGSLNAFVNSPARLDSVFTIGAYEHDYSPAPFSNYGKSVDVFAPGCGVVTGTLDNKKIAMNSTSAAMACVAGIAVEFVQQNNNATRKDFNSFIKRHFFNTGLTEYLDYYLAFDPVFTPDDQDLYASFWYASAPYLYRFPFIDEYLLAHCPYLKSKIIVNNYFLGEVYANSFFILQINAESKTIYDENKPLFYKLIGDIPSWASFEIGELSGKIFGTTKNVVTSTPCVFKVLIDDGTYSISKIFSFTVLTNDRTLFGVGANLKTSFTSDVVLNLTELKYFDILLDVNQLKNQSLKISSPLQRKVILLNKTTGSFVAKTHTDLLGNFLFYTPSGTFQALAIDENSVYNVIVLNNLRT